MLFSSSGCKHDDACPGGSEKEKTREALQVFAGGAEGDAQLVLHNGQKIIEIDVLEVKVLDKLDDKLFEKPAK